MNKSAQLPKSEVLLGEEGERPAARPLTARAAVVGVHVRTVVPVGVEHARVTVGIDDRFMQHRDVPEPDQLELGIRELLTDEEREFALEPIDRLVAERTTSEHFYVGCRAFAVTRELRAEHKRELVALAGDQAVLLVVVGLGQNVRTPLRQLVTTRLEPLRPKFGLETGADHREVKAPSFERELGLQLGRKCFVAFRERLGPQSFGGGIETAERLLEQVSHRSCTPRLLLVEGIRGLRECVEMFVGHTRGCEHKRTKFTRIHVGLPF